MKALRWLTWMPALLLVLGCGGSMDNEPVNDTETEAAGSGHDDHSVGPHGGHMLHLEPDGVHAEWTHDDETHEIVVYLDDLDDAAVKEVKFSVKIGDTEPQDFPLVAGEQGWTITSEELMTHINMSEGVEVSLAVQEGDSRLTTKIESHEHHHH